MKKGVFFGIFGLSAIVGLLLVVFRTEILPERFDGDAKSITAAAEAVREDPGAVYIDNYYTNAGRFYGAFGVADKPMLVGVVGYLIIASLVFVLLYRWEGGTNLDTWGALGVSGVALALSALFFGTLSKDIFGVVMVAAPLVAGKRQKWGFPASLVGAVIFGLIFRPYYVVVALVAGGYWLIWKFMRPELWQWAVVVIITVAMGAMGYLAVTGESISQVREVNNAGREATSMLTNVVAVDAGWWSGIVNSLAVGGLMILPVPLFAAGGLYHVLAGVLMMGVVALMIWLMRDNNFRKAASKGIVLLLGLFTLQCLFEPDLGSVLRHWTMLGVVIVYAYCAARGSYERT